MENKKKEDIRAAQEELLRKEDAPVGNEKKAASDMRQEFAGEAAKATGEERNRDFYGEVTALMEQYPEVRAMLMSGEGLPKEVSRACARENAPLRVAYAEYMAKKAKEEADQIRKENEILKQNAAAAGKAPVKGSVFGGADSKGMDPFLKGFHSDD